MKIKFPLLIITSLFLVFGLFIWTLREETRAELFSDVSPENPSSLAIEYLTDLGVIRGRANSKRFFPQLPLNRAEWVVMILRYLNIDPSLEEYHDCFPDVTDQWFAPAVCMAMRSGWVKGYQSGPDTGNYGPANPLNTLELLVILERIFDWPVIPGGRYWYTSALEYAQVTNILPSNIIFNKDLNRAEGSELLFRTVAIDLFEAEYYDPILGQSLLSEDTRPGIQASQTVILSSYQDEAIGSSLPRGATYVPVLRFQIQPRGDLTLSSLNITRREVGHTEDLQTGRLLIDGKLIKEARFSSQDNSIVWDELGYALKSDQTSIIEMNVDFREDSEVNLYYAFEISANQIHFSEGNVKVQGGAVRGERFQVLSEPVDTITIKNPNKKLKIPFVDSENEIIGRFIIRSGAHDVAIKGIRLEDKGNISPSRFSNFRLSVGSTELSSLDVISRNTLDFPIDNFLIEAGHEKTFTIFADLEMNQTRRNIRLFLDEALDLYAEDLAVGFGVRVDNQFGKDKAWCVGAESIICPEEGLRRRCTRADRENEVEDCIESGI